MGTEGFPPEDRGPFKDGSSFLSSEELEEPSGLGVERDRPALPSAGCAQPDGRDVGSDAGWGARRDVGCWVGCRTAPDGQDARWHGG